MFSTANIARCLITLFFLSVLFPSSIVAQSISGDVRSMVSERGLGYATVNIYKNGELVKNVLTDGSGDFKVKLDTGTYECEIVFAGHEKVTKTIEVNDDEKTSFDLEGDDESEYSAEELSSPSSPSKERARSMERSGRAKMASGATASRAPSIQAAGGWTKGVDAADSSKYGKLTAGEINDLADRDMWTGHSRKELRNTGKGWDFFPWKRYTVQVKGKQGLPIANARVLLKEQGEPVFSARTDNTGKAELWGSLSPEPSSGLKDPSIRIRSEEKERVIKEPEPFEEGVNSITLDQPCDRSEKMDIAIVMDATGSMADEIAYLRSDLNRVIYRSRSFDSELDLRFGNVFYRDHGDDFLVSSQDFTGVLSRSVGFIGQHDGEGGGDGPEAVEIALDSAIHHLEWREDTRSKLLFLVLDAPPHNEPDIRRKVERLCRAAAQKGIRIVPVTGSGMPKRTEYLMRSMALATNGTYSFLTDHSAVGGDHVEPTTKKDYDVELLNDLLVRIIKSYSYMPDCHQQMPDVGVELPDSQVVAGKDPDSTEASTPDSGGVEEVEWSYYPNPTRGILNIRTETPVKKLYICDLSGKVLRVIENIEPHEPVTADLSEFSSGIYLIRYRMRNDRWVSGKFTLSR